jgi:hypothetical protein
MQSLRKWNAFSEEDHCLVRTNSLRSSASVNPSVSRACDKWLSFPMTNASQYHRDQLSSRLNPSTMEMAWRAISCRSTSQQWLVVVVVTWYATIGEWIKDISHSVGFAGGNLRISLWKVSRKFNAILLRTTYAVASIYVNGLLMCFIDTTSHPLHSSRLVQGSTFWRTTMITALLELLFTHAITTTYFTN